MIKCRYSESWNALWANTCSVSTLNWTYHNQRKEKLSISPYFPQMSNEKRGQNDAVTDLITEFHTSKKKGFINKLNRTNMISSVS